MILGLSRRDGRRSSGSTRSPLNELLATGVPLLLRPAIAESGFAALGAAGDEELLIRTSDTLAGLAAFEWDGRTTTVFRGACFGPDPEALAAREAEVWGAWMYQHFPSQATAVEAHGS